MPPGRSLRVSRQGWYNTKSESGGKKMSSLDNVQFENKPTLRKPYIVCGLNGSFNVGNASVGVADYLLDQYGAIKFAAMPAARYRIYQMPGVDSLRPSFKMEEGLITEAALPSNEFYYATETGTDHDLILLRGDEPSLNWEEYAEAVVELAKSFDAARLFAVGSLLDMSPYTREPLISCTCSDAAVKQEMDNYNVAYSNREGMAAFGQMLVHTCRQKGLEAVNFTVRVPCYPEFNVFLGESPKSLKAVLGRLKGLMRFDLKFDELDADIKEMEGKLSFMRQQNPEFNTLIEELEKKYVEMPYQEALDLSADDAIRLAEEFLKNNGEE
jgi:proteasome assembly chaperone (PAC2) family protein